MFNSIEMGNVGTSNLQNSNQNPFGFNMADQVLMNEQSSQITDEQDSIISNNQQTTKFSYDKKKKNASKTRNKINKTMRNSTEVSKDGYNHFMNRRNQFNDNSINKLQF